MPLVTPPSGMRFDSRVALQRTAPGFTAGVANDFFASYETGEMSQNGLYYIQIGRFQPGNTANACYAVELFGGPFFMRGYSEPAAPNFFTTATVPLFANGNATIFNAGGLPSTYIRVLTDPRNTGGTQWGSMIQIIPQFNYYYDGTVSATVYKVTNV